MGLDYALVYAYHTIHDRKECAYHMLTVVQTSQVYHPTGNLPVDNIRAAMLSTRPVQDRLPDQYSCLIYDTMG